MSTLSACHVTFRRWFGDDYDLDVLDAALCTLAVERLDGDPLWLLVVSGPGAAKTETVQACSGAGAIVTSTITGEAAFLSGSPKREHATDATGGLLRVLGPRGVLVLKDVTSLISMNRDRRAEVLAAMREIADGRWQRNLGTDGGKTLTWEGRIAVLGACTTAWDAAHAVISTMGDRFAVVRLNSKTGRASAFQHTMANTGGEVQMRAELADAVGEVVDHLDEHAAKRLDPGAMDRLFPAADLVTLARTGVEYDYRGDVIDAHAPEMPTRFARSLQQIVRGGLAIGMPQAEAIRLAVRVARDSMPPIRLAVIDDLAGNPHSTPSDIRRRLNMPRATVDRQCQALHLLGVLGCDEVEYGNSGKVRWHYCLASGVDPTSLRSFPEMFPPQYDSTHRQDISGKDRAPSTAGRETGGTTPRSMQGVP